MEKNKKRKRNTLVLLALLALLIGLLIPFTWRSFNAVKASLLQESTLSTTNSDSISGFLMHGGWVPSSTPTNRPSTTFTATVPPSATSTVTNTPPIPLNFTSTVTNTATYPPKVTETLQPTSTSTLIVTKTVNPNLTTTPPTNVPFGGTGTPEVTESSTPTASASPPPCLLCTATAQFALMATTAPTPIEVPPTPVPSLPPTVGPGGNPGSYSTLGFVFGLIAVAAFFLYFSGLIISKRDSK